MTHWWLQLPPAAQWSITSRYPTSAAPIRPDRERNDASPTAAMASRKVDPTLRARAIASA